MSATGTKHENYESGKIKLLYHLVETAFATEQKQDYEILVDGYKVVPRNNDPEKFYDYDDFINSDTQTVTIIMFKKGSKSNDKYFYHIKGIPNQNESLSGIPEGMTATEYEAKQKEKLLREIRFDELEKENASLKENITAKENEIKELNKNFDELKAGKLLSMSEIGTNVLMGILSNPSIQKKFPVLNGLSGTPPQTQPETAQEENASFKRKGEPSHEEEESEEEGLTEEDRRYLILIRDLQIRLTKFQLTAVMHILDVLTKYPIAIGSTQKHLNNFLGSRINNPDQP